MFDAYEISLELARSLRPYLKQLRACDSSLTNQLTRAMTSVPLNLSEGRSRVGKDRVHLFRVAAGSVAEVRACLQTAEALGYLSLDDAAVSLTLIDRVQAMCWGLTHPG
jgi:four helix bundle protein